MIMGIAASSSSVTSGSSVVGLYQFESGLWQDKTDASGYGNSLSGSMGGNYDASYPANTYLAPGYPALGMNGSYCLTYAAEVAHSNTQIANDGAFTIEFLHRTTTKAHVVINQIDGLTPIIRLGFGWNYVDYFGAFVEAMMMVNDNVWGTEWMTGAHYTPVTNVTMKVKVVYADRLLKVYLDDVLRITINARTSQYSAIARVGNFLCRFVPLSGSAYLDDLVITKD